jgi:TRAP-type C4-dicarboxylate transport system substrate-binding protein
MAQKEWCDLLEKNTTGKIKCNILPRGVSPAPGTMDAVKNGLADVSYTVHGYTPGRFVLTQMAEVPVPGRQAPSRCRWRSTASPASTPNLTPNTRRASRPLAYFTHGPGIVFNTKRPITKAEDLQRPEVPRGRRHGQRDLQGAGHERHAQAGP